MSEKTAKKARREERTASLTGKVPIKCVFPPCNAQVLVAAPPEGVAVGSPQHVGKLGGIPMCAKHGEMLGFYVWAQMNIKMQPQQTKGGIILPGNPNYETTLKDQPLTKEQILNQRRP